MRPAWAGAGRNYDPDLLVVSTAVKGFTIGVSLIGGPDLLGGDGADVELPGEFTSITHTQACQVEDGLFVNRDVEVLTVTGTLPDSVELKGGRLAVAYDGEELFRGTVTAAEWVESVDLRGDLMPGNTAGKKTFRVSLVATTGDEQLARAVTPARDWDSTLASAARVESYLGMTTVMGNSGPFDGGPELGHLFDNVGTMVDAQREIAPEDSMPPLREALQDQLKLTGRFLDFEPWESTVVLRNNADYYSGEPFLFTDNPANDPQTGSGFTHDGRHASYITRSWGEDASMFTRGIAVRIVDPTTDPDTETVYGPYRVTDVFPDDVVVDLGKNSMAWQYPAEIARSFAATLPLKTRSEPFTKSLEMPLQSIHQVAAVAPSQALVEANGATERVAVLGIVHGITPDKWMVGLTLGPHHLVTRESDFDPFAPDNITALVSGGGSGPNITLEWDTPRCLPAGVPLLRVVAIADNETVGASWSTTRYIKSAVYVSEQPGDPQTWTGPHGIGPGLTATAMVFYTTNEDVGNGVISTFHREGQPALVPFNTF